MKTKTFFLGLIIVCTTSCIGYNIPEGYPHSPTYGILIRKLSPEPHLLPDTAKHYDGEIYSNYGGYDYYVQLDIIDKYQVTEQVWMTSRRGDTIPITDNYKY